MSATNDLHEALLAKDGPTFWTCNVIKTISIAQYTVQTAARALNIVNKQYTLSQTE